MMAVKHDLPNQKVDGKEEKLTSLTSDGDITLLKSFHCCYLAPRIKPRVTTVDLEALQHLAFLTCLI